MKVFHLSQAEPIGERCICLMVNDLRIAGPRDVNREMPNKRFFFLIACITAVQSALFALMSQP